MNNHRIVILGLAILGSALFGSVRAMSSAIIMDFDAATPPLEVIYLEDGFEATAINSGVGTNHFDVLDGSPVGGRFARLHGGGNANAEEVVFDFFGSAFDLISIDFLAISGSGWLILSSNGGVLSPTATGVTSFVGPDWQNITSVTMVSILLPGDGTLDFDNVTFDGTPTVPEPSTIVLLGMGLVGVAVKRYWISSRTFTRPRSGS